jgi:hypothetical protein
MKTYEGGAGKQQALSIIVDPIDEEHGDYHCYAYNKPVSYNL